MALGRVSHRPPAAPTVLVLRALGLGDLLVAVPVLRALRRARPDARLVLAAPAGLAPLAALSGAVDEVLPTAGLDGPPPALDRPALAVNLHGRGPRSSRLLLATRPDRLWAYAHPELPELDGPQWTQDVHEVLRWCRLVERYGVPADPADLLLPAPAGTANPAPGAVLVHPGAAYGSRRWPADRFAAVAAALRAAGHRVVVTGGPSERDLAAEVAERAGLSGPDVLAGRTGLLELAALVAGARLVVCGDTGVAHLASAYRTPSVLLFGPTPPARWGPPAGPHTVLWRGAGRAAAGDPHGDRPDPALLDLQVRDVLAAAIMLLEDRDTGPDTRRGAVRAAVAP